MGKANQSGTVRRALGFETGCPNTPAKGAGSEPGHRARLQAHALVGRVADSSGGRRSTSLIGNGLDFCAARALLYTQHFRQCEAGHINRRATLGWSLNWL